MSLLPQLQVEFSKSRNVESVVLFGSSAVRAANDLDGGYLSDLDLHIVVRNAQFMELVRWDQIFPGEVCHFQFVRPATGGVRKMTAVFSREQIDIVIVPSLALRMIRVALFLRLDDRVRFIRVGVDEMATCLRTGYRFLKGESEWGRFYRLVAAREGVRLPTKEAVELADAFLGDLLWFYEKIFRGELVAARHVLYTRLIDTNLKLWREIRLRRRLPLTSFGLGRRFEMLANPAERRAVEIGVTGTKLELLIAGGQALEGLCSLMREITIEWSPAPTMLELLRAMELRLRAK